MGLRPEHLERIVRRGQENEAMLRLIVVEALADLVDTHLERPKEAEKMLDIFESLQADEGKYTPGDYVQAVNEAIAPGEVIPPEKVQRRMDLYYKYLFPPTLE